MRVSDRSRISRRDVAPPGIQRAAITGQSYTHSIRELDPIREIPAGHGDHDRNIGAQGALDQITKALARTLLLAKAVDDQDIGALIDRPRNSFAGIEQLIDVEATRRGAGTEIVKQPQPFAGMNHRRAKTGIEAATTELDETKRTISATIQVGSESAQDLIRVLVVFIDQGRKVALRVEHDARYLHGTDTILQHAIFFYISRSNKSGYAR